MAKRSRRIDDLSIEDSFIRGVRSESVAAEALEDMLRAGEILDYEKSGESHERLGMDFIVHYHHSDEVVMRMPLQVKSSWNNVAKHRQRYPDIPCIVVHGTDTAHEVAEKIRLKLNQSHPLVEALGEELYKSLTYQNTQPGA